MKSFREYSNPELEESTQLEESHFKVGQKVKCIHSGKEGVVTKVDPSEKGKYYTVKRDDGEVMQYAPDDLEALKEEFDLEENEKSHPQGSAKFYRGAMDKYKAKTPKKSNWDMYMDHKNKTKKEEVELEEAAPRPPKLGKKGMVMAKDGKNYKVDMIQSTRKIEFKVTNEFGDFKTISVGQLAKMFK